MKICLDKTEIENYYVNDPESDMQDVYTILEKHFGDKDWILKGTFKEIENELSIILQKYPMDLILNRFLNSKLAYYIMQE